MITIEPPFYLAKGVTVFRDHADPDLFYFLPGAPVLAHSDGRASFTLYKYLHDLVDNPGADPTRAKGAGMALFEVEIPLGAVAALTADISSQSGRTNARLVPVAFRTATVRALVAHVDGDHLIDDLVETHDAPLTAPWHTAFALALTAEGATLMQQAALGGALPVGVAYEFRFLALTPSLHARATMNYNSIYDHFSASLGFTYYVSLKLDLDFSWLVEHDFIKIEITSFTDDADQERQRNLVLGLIGDRIKGDFFRAAPPQQTDDTGASPLSGVLGTLGGSGGKLSSASAMFVLKLKYEVVNTTKDLVLTYDGRNTVELTHGVSGFLSAMAQGGPPPDIREIDLGDGFFAALTVSVSSVVDFAALADVTAATVNLAFADHRTSYLFTRDAAGPFSFQAALAHFTDDEYRYDVQYDFDTALGVGPARLAAGPFTSRSRVLVVDPMAHFRSRRVTFLLGPMDPARVPRMHVALRVPADEDGADDVARDSFTLDAATPEHTWRMHASLPGEPLRVLVATQWEDPQGHLHDADSAEVTGDSWVVAGPFRDLLVVLVEALADWKKTTALTVELRYQDGDEVVDRVLAFAATTPASQRIEIPLFNPTRRQYQWRQVVQHSDGTSSQTDWAASDVSALVAGTEPKITADLRVVWVGAPGDALGMRVDVWATAAGGETQQSAFLRAGGDGEQTVTLPLDADGALHYRYEVRKVGPSGEELIRSGEGTSNLLVVQTGAS